MSSMETYDGHVRSPADAIVLFEACRLGLLPRVQRRLSEKERSQIKSGSVFVWDEREAGMRRWTDGKSWSASRVSGSFLTYREMEGKRGNSGFPVGATPNKTNGSKSATESQNGDSDEGDEGPDGYRYKPDGLMKQSFSITTQDGRHLHLISYYKRSHNPPLKNPSTDAQLRNIQPPKSMYPENTVNEPTTMTPVGRPASLISPPYAGAARPLHAPPPAGMIVAYPWYPPPGYGYPAPPWPPSPSATPPVHYAYPPPHYMHAAFAPPHMPPFPHQVHPHAFERAPPTPQNSLPPPQSSNNGPTSPGGWQQIPSPGAPPHHGAPSGHHPSPYSGPHISHPSQAPSPYPSRSPHPSQTHPSQAASAAQQSHASQSAPPYQSSQPPSQGPALAPVTNGYKPLSPPATETPVPTSKPYSEPPPLKDIPASTTTSSIIPSINALINGPPPDAISRTNSRSPPRSSIIKDLPSTMSASLLQRDRGDIKKLDSQLLKSKS